MKRKKTTLTLENDELAALREQAKFFGFLRGDIGNVSEYLRQQANGGAVVIKLETMLRLVENLESLGQPTAELAKILLECSTYTLKRRPKDE